MKRKPSTALDMFCIPLSLCYYFWPDTFDPEDFDCDLPSSSFDEARDLFKFWPDVHDRFGSFAAYLLWIIEFIGGDAPAFSAVFLDELHKLERPSSSSFRL